MKSVNTNDNIQNLINKMAQNDGTAILIGAKSDKPILNLNAVIFGTKFKCKSQDFIDVLKTKLFNSDKSFMGTPLKVFVTAALDILEVKKYNGNDAEIRKLINSNFDFD